jgi:hypothetical protein
MVGALFPRGTWRGIHVNRNKIAVLMALSMLGLSGCGGLLYMLRKDSSPTASSIQPAPGKAALVVARTTAFGGAVWFTTYLEKEVIGVTGGKSYFAKTDIEPGEHYVVSSSENKQAVKVNFEPGKTYYMLQNVSMGVMRARVVAAATDAKFLDSGELSGCTYYAFGPTEKPEALADADYAEVIKEADTWVMKPDGSSEFVPQKK